MMLLLLACTITETRERIEPSFVSVTLDTTETGTQDAPIPFSSAPVSVGLSLQTLDVHQQPYAFNGQMTVSVRPAILDSDPRVTVVDGKWSGTVQFHSAFGSTRVWFTDDLPSDDRVTPGYGTGVSDELWYRWPTIAEMQTTDDHETNQLDHEFAELRMDDRQVVVTATDSAGFWVTDLADPAGSYNNLYVYTFNKPDDDIAVGVQIVQMGGINQEYLASTQLSNPVYAVGTATLTPYPAIELDDTTACDNDAMERLEGAQVRASNSSIPSTFTEDSEDYQDYLDYGQWPIAVGSCTIYAESGSTAPDFHPDEHAGETFTYVEGMLKEVYGKWVLVVLQPEQIMQPAGPPAPRHRRILPR